MNVALMTMMMTNDISKQRHTSAWLTKYGKESKIHKRFVCLFAAFSLSLSLCIDLTHSMSILLFSFRAIVCFQ